MIGWLSVDWDPAKAERHVMDMTRRFLQNSIAPLVNVRLDHTLTVSWQTEDQFGTHTRIPFERSTEGQNLWVVSVIYNLRRQEVYLLHWNGPARIAERTIIPILQTFELLEMER